MSSNNKLDKNGLNVFWTKVFTLVKTITGDVDVKNKGTLQNQVDDVSTKVTDCFTSVSNGKKVVANAITGKGITTAEDAEFATMADNINKIKSNPTLQAKSATLHTGNIKVTLTPDDGYDGLSAATASITLQEKSVTLSTTAQTVTPDSGKVLSKVSVPAVAGNAATNNVLAGKTFNSATAGIGKTGTMKSKAGTSVKASATSQDDNNTYLTIPEAGYYDETSKVYTENSNLGNVNVPNGMYLAVTGGLSFTLESKGIPKEIISHLKFVDGYVGNFSGRNEDSQRYSYRHYGAIVRYSNGIVTAVPSNGYIAVMGNAGGSSSGWTRFNSVCAVFQYI